ncbi:MAG: response regulator transcription factor [Bryobacteraceae bacterium]
MKKPRILLADDHRIVLEGLRGLLADEFELLGTAADGRELIDLCTRLHPDLVVADISMPLLNGIDAVRQLREQGVTAKFVFLTMHRDQTYATRALDAGASGYVLKHAASDELVTAIHAALRGETYMSEALRNPAREESLLTGGKALADITNRQREVLQLFAEGKSAKEVAALLGISPRTAETHKYKLMDELGVKTTAELVQYAIRHGLVSG